MSHIAPSIVLILASCSGVAGAQPAQDPSKRLEVVEAASPGAPEVRVVRGPEGLALEGGFRVAASRAVAWAVLTDYDGIDRFVSSMRESRIAGHGSDHVLVHQVAVGRLFLFSRRMHTTLKVIEEPYRRIRFEDVLHQDFERYEGEWRIEGHDRALEIVYRVEAKPRLSLPDFAVRGSFARTVRQLLQEVEQEITHRTALVERQPSERSSQ